MSLYLAAALTLFIAGSAPAAPTDPATVTLPPDIAAPFIPGVRAVADLAQDYVEEEYFVSGAANLFTYPNSFHFDANDGYFVQQAASACPINFGPGSGDDGVPAFPGCTPRLQGTNRLLRTDLPVPVYHANTERT
jgi:hypothetical protein